MQRILRKELEPNDIGDSNEKYADNHKQGDKKEKGFHIMLHPFVDYSIPAISCTRCQYQAGVFVQGCLMLRLTVIIVSSQRFVLSFILSRGNNMTT